MISPKVARIIEILPTNLVGALGKKILDYYLKKYANIHVEGIEGIKNIERPIIFICNHLSNSDGLVLNKVLNILNDLDVTFIAGVKLKGDVITKLGTYCVKTTPIKPNTADKEGISKVISILKNGGKVLLFPEGTRSRTGQMIEAKKGLLLFHKLSKAVIVPIGIHGTEKLLPINKAGNMYEESFQHADVYVKFGEPFDMEKIQKGEDKKEHENKVMEDAMRRIAALIPEEYRGFYK